MRSLASLCIVQCSKTPGIASKLEVSGYEDAEIRYIRELGKRLEEKKNRYFFELCRCYFIFYSLKHGEEYTDYKPVDLVNLKKLTHWQRAMVTACEVCFGDLYSAENCVLRIRDGLPNEHKRGRNLKFTMEKFEETLQRECPGMKGNVHAWYKVFMNGPPEMLLFDDVFG